ncbi:hypothetical protein [Niallia sp. FSL R7-0271]|uniref:hypothetical protein n=1 Tax=Niallia sp. FSL R7-0271 TaxID=2921678 RepID=UPI0030F8888F
MTERKPDFQIGDVVVEVKSDMRDRLVANLRQQARQSKANRQVDEPTTRKHGPHRKGAAVTAKISMVEGEPQAVLIKNRTEYLAKDIKRLRSRYANILAEQTNE